MRPSTSSISSAPYPFTLQSQSRGSITISVSIPDDEQPPSPRSLSLSVPPARPRPPKSGLSASSSALSPIQTPTTPSPLLNLPGKEAGPQSRLSKVKGWFTTSRTLIILFWTLSLLTFAAGTTFTFLTLAWLFPSHHASSITVASSSGGTVNSTSLPHDISLLPLIIPKLDQLTLLITGLILLTSFFLSLPSINSKATRLLSWLNVLLTLNILLIIAGGGILWWRSLRTRFLFWTSIWLVNPPASMAIQEKFRCCGYFDPSEAVLGGTICPTRAVADGMKPCVDPFSNHAINLLGGLSTGMFAMAGVLSVWVLVNGCVVSERRMQERFRQIEEKHRHSTWVV